MLEEEKWTTPSMTYFRPHFMMPGPGEAAAHEPATNGASASAYEKLQRGHTSQPWWLNYDQALDLGQNNTSQQKATVTINTQQHKTIKHEQVDQARYGFDQVNYSGGQPSSIKKKEEGGVTAGGTQVALVKYACDQCSYVATQKSSLSRHKMTQHEGIKQPSMAQLNGKTYDCDLCAYQATQLSSLKRHKMAKHSGQQFVCDMCDYIGTTNNNLRLHKRSKHEGVRFPCDMCGYEATQPGVLNRHKQQKHGWAGPNEGAPRQHHTTNHNGQVRVMRDPNAPKRPLSGFFHFSNVGRAKVKAANPEYTVGQISQELSRRWHALDEVTKSMFEEMSNNDKARFQREKAEYHMSPKGGYKQTRAKKDPSAPKRPLCGFMCFSQEERAKVRLLNPNAGVGEIGKELGKRWAEAPQEVRDKFNAIATMDKERFVKEKQEYQMSPLAGQWRGRRAKKNPDAPKRNVPGFMWFSNAERASVREEHPGLRVGDVAKEMSRRWATCDPETKQRFEQMAFEDKQRYEREKHEWHMKQRQIDMENRPPSEQQQSPSYQAQKTSWNNNTANGGTLAVTQVHPTSPPTINVTHAHPTSPPLTIHHNPTPTAPAVRYVHYERKSFLKRVFSFTY